jgi:hypothetical protein
MASETPVNDTPVVASQTSGTDTHDTLAATKINDPNTYKNARAFLAKHKDIEILRHWTTAPIPGAPAILDHAIGVAPDLEWHPENQNRVHGLPDVRDERLKGDLPTSPPFQRRYQSCTSESSRTVTLEQPILTF